jgi:hypothetical protein
MKFSTSLVVALAAGLIAATPVLAQSNNDTTKPDSAMSSGQSKKQKTQGMPVGSQPQQYGTAAKKQQTQGAPAGFEPTQYGAAATKQKTAGVPNGYEPQQYGSSPASKTQ